MGICPVVVVAKFICVTTLGMFVFLYLFYLISIQSCIRAKNYVFILKIFIPPTAMQSSTRCLVPQMFLVVSLSNYPNFQASKILCYEALQVITLCALKFATCFFFTSMIFKCMIFNRLIVDCHTRSNCNSWLVCMLVKNICDGVQKHLQKPQQLSISFPWICYFYALIVARCRVYSWYLAVLSNSKCCIVLGQYMSIVDNVVQRPQGGHQQKMQELCGVLQVCESLFYVLQQLT